MAQSGTLFDMLGTDENSKRQASRARSIDKLSEIGGLASQPQSPFAAGTSGLGVSPDQAKMAGSSAQLQAAPTIAPPKGPAASAVAQGAVPEQQQALEQQRAQTATTATANDEALRQLATEMETTVGSLGQRVRANYGGAITDQMTQATAGAVVDVAGTVDALPNAAAVRSTIAALNAATTPAERNAAIDALEKEIGGDGALARGVVGAILASTDHDAYSSYLASTLPENVTVAQLNAHAKKDGTTPVLDIAALSTQLGLSAEAIAAMDVPALRNAINDKITSTFSETDKLRNQMNDPNLSATDRADIRKQLENAGERGLEATEAEMRDLKKIVATAGDITLADGSTLAIEDVLNDDSFKILMGKVLDGDKAAIAELNAIPELKEFYETNKALIDAAYTKTIKDSESWNALETAQDNMATTFAGDPSVLSAIRAAAGVTSTTGPVYDPKTWQAMLDNPVMKMVTDPALSADARTKVVMDLGTAMKVGKLTLDQISAYDPDDLKALGFGTDPTKFASAMATVNILNDPAATPDAIIDAMIPGNTINFSEVASNLTAQMGAVGIIGGSAPSLITLLDADKDNVISPEELRAGLSTPSVLGEVLKLGKTAYDPVNPFEGVPGFANPADFPGGIGAGLAAITADGVVKPGELASILTPTALADTGGLLALAGVSGLRDAVRQEMPKAQDVMIQTAIDKGIAQLNTARASVDDLMAKMKASKSAKEYRSYKAAYAAAVAKYKAAFSEYQTSSTKLKDTLDAANKILGLETPASASLFQKLTPISYPAEPGFISHAHRGGETFSDYLSTRLSF